MNRLRGVFFLAHVVVLPLRRPPTEAKRDSLVIRIASREELYLAAERMPEQLDPDIVDVAMDRGDLCVGIVLWRANS